jgi:hypothetical protein
MKKAALAALLLVLVPLQAQALDTEELLGLVAMPLAVAAASEVTGTPVSELSHFVATLNRANVPPTQVVQVVRYAPAALVIEDQQPAFIEYVDTQVDQGIVGNQLVTVIEDRYETYDLEPQFLTFDEPATTYVVREDYIPQVVVTRLAEVRPSYVVGDTNDLLALAAMPLAVAAVADITGVPFSDLSSLVASLNAARMPPMQVVEVLRYSPVVMVDPYERPRFVEFVNTQVVSGVTGPRLIEVIDDRFVTYDVDPSFEALQPAQIVEVVEDRDDFFPAVVTSRVAAVRAHPHGGPPGQLKKELGLQTGAEVVHGTPRGKASRVVVSSNRGSDERRVVREQRKPVERVATSREPARKREITRSKPRVEQRPRVERQRSERPKVERQRVERAQQPRVERAQRPRVERAQRVVQPRNVDRGHGNAGGGKSHGSGNAQGKGKGKGKG